MSKCDNCCEDKEFHWELCQKRIVIKKQKQKQKKPSKLGEK